MTIKEEIEALEAKLNELKQREIEEAKPKAKPKRWRAVKGSRYYYAGDYGIVSLEIDDRHEFDNNRYKIGNYFRTEEEVKNSNIYKVLNSEYEYWFACFSELPEELPEDCEAFIDEWQKETHEPRKWIIYNRRWRRK